MFTMAMFNFYQLISFLHYRMFERKVGGRVSSCVREKFCRVLSIEPAPEQEHTVRGGPGHVAPPALQVGLQLQGVGGGPGDPGKGLTVLPDLRVGAGGVLASARGES